MDGVDEPCSPTPPTGHQHQSGHLMCYEGRTSSRAIDRPFNGACAMIVLDPSADTTALRLRLADNGWSPIPVHGWNPIRPKGETEAEREEDYRKAKAPAVSDWPRYNRVP